jgi:hypothetical protein
VSLQSSAGLLGPSLSIARDVIIGSYQVPEDWTWDMVVALVRGFAVVVDVLLLPSLLLSSRLNFVRELRNNSERHSLLRSKYYKYDTAVQRKRNEQLHKSNGSLGEILSCS